ncbi:Na+-dependent transporter [Xanthobacter sp. AM11]|uniref:Na+-dependent transporter n=1 Tax=Xanthobacter sp. AM11 TaxID=3380643 RepID=UPI0039BF08E2
MPPRSSSPRSSPPGSALVLLSLLSRGLAALGRRSAPAVAASVFVGLALPPLAALAKPLIVPAILALLTLAFLRTEPAGGFGGRRAVVGLLAIGWIMLALPAGLGAVTLALGEPSDLTLALLMQACAPPIMSAPAFALLLGLDPRLVLAVMVGSMVLTPLSAPLLVAFFSHGALALDSLGLALRLGAVLGGTAGAGLGLRRLVTPARIARLRAHLDGANVLLLGLLAVGLMDGVTAWFMADPAFVLGLTGLAFALSLSGLGLTALVFRAVGAGDALMLGFAAGHRNISVMIAATGAALPPETWLYVAAAQFPIYLMPLFLLPLARRIRARDAGGREPAG